MTNICHLPEHVLLKTFQYLGYYDLVLGVRKTCLAWHDLSYNCRLWQTIYCEEFGSRFSDTPFLEMLEHVSHLVEKIVYGLLMSMSNHAFLHKDIICPSLKHLDFCLTRVSDVTLAKIITKYPKLEGLEVHACGNVNIYNCLTNICQLSNLKTIKFDDFGHDEQPHLFNTKLIKVFQCCPLLENVMIDSAQIQESSIQSLFENSKYLKKLVLGYCNELSVDIFRNMTNSLLKLAELGLTYTSVDDKFLEKIVQNAPNLKYLDITGSASITDLSLMSVGLHCENLHTIVINKYQYDQGGSITDVGLRSIADGCPKLNTLVVDFCLHVGDPGIIAVAKKCPKLVEIGLSGCLSITDQAISALANHCTDLQQVHLTECKQITSASINLLVSKCRWIQMLSLHTCTNMSNLNFDEMDNTDDCISKIAAKSAAKQPQCEGNPGCSYESFYAIHTQLSIHSHIKHLYLSYCSKINDDSIKQIAKHCPDLVKLMIQGCVLVSDSAIETLVTSCQYLQVLDISSSMAESSNLTNASLIAIGNYCTVLNSLAMYRNEHITLDGIENVIHKCPVMDRIELSVGDPFRISLAGLSQVLQQFDDRIVKICNEEEIEASGSQGNIVICLVPIGRNMPSQSYLFD